MTIFSLLWVRRFAVMPGALLALLVAFEGALQVREIGKRREILAGRSAADLGTVRAAPPLLYTLKPGWHDVFNSHGFRDVERSKTKNDGVWRLAVVGDSVTMQKSLPREKLYVRRLEHLLQEALPGAGIECPAFGVTGYCAAQASALMRDTVLDFDPDAILWQFHLNDASDPVIDGDNGGLGRYYARPRSQVWATLRRKMDHLLRKGYVRRRYPGLKQRDLQLQAWHWDDTGRVIEQVHELSVSREIPVFVVLFPSFPEDGDWGRYSEADMRLYGALVERFEAAGFPTLDLMPVFKRREVSEIQREPGDPWHPNARGHRIMARAISKWLIEEDLLNEGGPW
ncbi:MAG: SGNH/GDSL hydrolase family protein [Acidobacteriota bacterium]